MSTLQSSVIRRDTDGSHANRFLLAGAALVGAGLVTVNPAMPVVPDLQHRSVQLTSVGAAADADPTGWAALFANTAANLSTLGQEFMEQPFAVLTQTGHNLSDYIQLVVGMQDVPINESGSKVIDSGLLGLSEGFQALIMGTDKTPGIAELLQLMITDIQNGNPVEAFNELNLWFLHGLEGLAKPVVPVVTIPDRMLENFSNVIFQMFGPVHLWDFVKGLSKTVLSPMIGFGYEFSTILGQIGSGDPASLINAPADLINAVVNGYPVPDSTSVFTGLINSGSIVEDLLINWPQQIAQALTVGTADLHGASVDAATTGLDSLLGTVDPTDFLNDLLLPS